MYVKLIDLGLKKQPERAHVTDAGLDVFLNDDVTLFPNIVAKIPLGFGLDVPNGYMACIFPKSGLTHRGIIAQIPPIDCGYQGEVHALVTNVTKTRIYMNAGEKIGQLVFMPISIVTLVSDMGKQRGEGGFGSTGI